MASTDPTPRPSQKWGRASPLMVVARGMKVQLRPVRRRALRAVRQGFTRSRPKSGKSLVLDSFHHARDSCQNCTVVGDDFSVKLL